MSIFSTHFHWWFFTENAYKNLLSTNLFAPTTQDFARALWRYMTRVPPKDEKDFQVRKCNLILKSGLSRFISLLINMPSNARCAVGCCDNDSRYREYLVVRSHVQKLIFHKWSKDEKLAEIWRKQVRKSRSDDFNPALGAQGTFVCSNHFPLWQRTPKNPETDFPSIFLTASDCIHSVSPKKRKANRLVQQRSSFETVSTESPTQGHSDNDDEWEMSESDYSSSSKNDPSVTVPMRFEQITRESDVKFFTGLPSTEAFICLFEYLLPKAKTMQYWRGATQTQKEYRKEPSATQQYGGRSDTRVGPPRKLSLEQELLLTLMKLRLALLLEDLSFRFEISTGTTSSILVTWIKLCSKELSVLIIWPTRGQIKKTLPNCFRKLYPKVRCIIDCFECFTETPSGLDLTATM